MLMASKELSLDVPRIIKLRGLKTNIKILPPILLQVLGLPGKSESILCTFTESSQIFCILTVSLTNWFSLDWWWGRLVETRNEMRKFHYKCFGASIVGQLRWEKILVILYNIWYTSFTSNVPFTKLETIKKSVWKKEKFSMIFNSLN